MDISIYATESYNSTSVCIADLNTIVDIETIFKYIPIDDTILGIKYHGRYKGKVKQSGSFFNQISIVIFSEKYNKQINLKVFTNGKLQMTGIKSIDQCVFFISLFLSKIKDIKGTETIEIYNDNINSIDVVNVVNTSHTTQSDTHYIMYNKQEYDLYVGKKHNRFYSIKMYAIDNSNNYKIIGERKGNDFTLNVFSRDTFTREGVYLFDNYFIAIKYYFCEKGIHVKNVYDTRGNEIGYIKFIFIGKRKKIIITGTKFIRDGEIDMSIISDEIFNGNEKELIVNTYSVYNKYNKFIGKQILFITKDCVDNKSAEIKRVNTINYKYNCVEDPNFNFSKKVTNVKIININCNFELYYNNSKLHVLFSSKEAEYCLLRDVIYDTIKNKYPNIQSIYNPESKNHASLILKVKLKDDEEFKSTILIFKNGKIIVTGCNSQSRIDITKKYILDILNKYSDIFLLYKTCDSNRGYAVKQDNSSTQSSKISIYDIL